MGNAGDALDLYVGSAIASSVDSGGKDALA
jgi:hypothetical protein